MPANSIDSVITSPPYWQMREYEFDRRFSSRAIGNESTADEYVNNLVDVFQSISRVLKKSGSLWLNIGDKYNDKNLMGMPWRVALALQAKGWILRNDVIWVKMKGTQSSKDRLRNIHEHLFHFVKSKKYYYDADSILTKHTKKPTLSNGRIVSATGVSGDKYKRLIEESDYLSQQEKKHALTALEGTLELMRRGELNDLRMTIRGGQRTLHSNNGSVSGRARELEEKGFFIITSKAKGFMPSDVWRIVPEDECREDAHYAVFPIELLKTPILATTPIGGVVLDPFVGTGSAVTPAKGNRDRHRADLYRDCQEESIQDGPYLRSIFIFLIMLSLNCSTVG
jgi:DNA modification methylase